MNPDVLEEHDRDAAEVTDLDEMRPLSADSENRTPLFATIPTRKPAAGRTRDKCGPNALNSSNRELSTSQRWTRGHLRFPDIRVDDPVEFRRVVFRSSGVVMPSGGGGGDGGQMVRHSVSACASFSAR